MPSTRARSRVSWPGPAPTSRGCAVHGLGTALPDRVISSSSVAERLGLKEEWIVQRLGVRRRHVLAEGERLSDLAALAGRRALADAALEPAELDLVVAASGSQDELIPNMAPLVAEGVGAAGVGAFDVGAACSGFITGLSVGAAQIEAGRAEAVLVIGADALSHHTDPDDRRTAPLFADGAGAVVLRPDEDVRIGPARLWTDTVGVDLVHMHRDTQVIYMEGLETYRHAVASLTDATRSILETTGLEIADIDLFVYHQANARILGAVADRLGLEERQRVSCIAETGNTSAASIPLALASVAAEGRLHPGSRVLLGAIGGGFIWGTCLLEWAGRGEDGKNAP